jgi:transposase
LIDAIAFKYRTGTPWMDLPEHFGSWKGVHNRLRKWAADGTWEHVFTALLAQADAEGDLAWVVAVDSTIVRAHQHAAGARQKGPRLASRTILPSDGPAAVLTTKIHLAADSRCRPLAFVLTPGQAGDAPAFAQVMPACECRGRSADPGPPRKWSWPIRRTRPGRSAVIYGGVGSGQ